MPGDCPAVAASAVGSPVRNIPLQAERYSAGGQKVFAFPRERCSPSDRNTVRDHTGIAFIFDRIPPKSGIIQMTGLPLQTQASERPDYAA